jgi:predicted SAM-dependent methyltransferase
MRIFKEALLRTRRILGYEIRRIAANPNGQVIDKTIFPEQPDEYFKKLKKMGVDKAHYGCGPKLFGDGWANIDFVSSGIDPTKVYIRTNLASKHPFPSDFFKFSFAEDFIEHLDQSDSLVFLAEAFRTLQPGGILRLSFPGLRGVLRRHYKSIDYAGISAGKQDAYNHWGHKHFYCEESLSIVAHHIGFSEIEFVDYGESIFTELRNLDTRSNQKDLNIYVELRK